MSDVENEMEVLQRELAAKTREIEALVAKQQHLGDLDALETTDYARLRTYGGTDLQLAGGERSFFPV